MDFNQRKILVTGSKGFIGTNFVEMILKNDQNCVVFGLDHINYASNNHLHSANIIGSYREIIASTCDDRIYDHLPKDLDCIVHFACESHVDKSVESIDPFIQSNIVGSTKLAQFAIKHGIPMINVSTDEVYGELTSIEDDGFRETTPIDPRNPYSATKASVDMIIQSLSNQHPHWKVVTTRCGNNFGRYQDSTKFIPVIINSILSGKKIPVYGDGNFYRSWIHVNDHCNAIRKLMEHLISGLPMNHKVYNIGTNRVMSNIELIRYIAMIIKSPVGDMREVSNFDINDIVKFIDDPRGACHDRIYKINYDRIYKEFLWYPRETTQFGMAMSDTVMFYKRKHEQEKR